MTADTDRALGVGIIAFIIVITIAALLFTLTNPGVSLVFDVNSAATSNADAQSHIDTLETIWGLVLFYALFLAGLFVIARSVFESRRGI